MKQEPNELRVAVEEKSIKVDGFSTGEQLRVFVVGWCLPQYLLLFVCVSFCIHVSVSMLFPPSCFGDSGAIQTPQKRKTVNIYTSWTRVLTCTYTTWWNNLLSHARPLHNTSNPSRPVWRGATMVDRTHSHAPAPVGLWLFLDKRPPGRAGVQTCTCD